MNGINGHGPPSAAYVGHIVAEECAIVESAPPGTANATLHKAAVKLGTMTGAGWLDRTRAEDALSAAASKRCDDRREARRTIASGLDWGEQHPRADADLSTPKFVRSKSAKRSDGARRLFADAGPIGRSIAATYLAGRGLVAPYPDTLRYHPNTPMLDGNCYSAIIAEVTVPTSGKFLAVQRTALAPDGSGKAKLKTPKASFGATAGGAIVLGDLAGATTLLEGEGVETVLSACQATGLPGIATLSAGTLGKPPLPPGLGVIVLGDIGSERAAEAGAQRRIEEGRSVRIAYPPAGGGKDFNDLLRSEGNDAVRAAVDESRTFEPKPADPAYSARCLADVEPQSIRWLWPRRIALGKLGLVAGHPGRGKSTLTLFLAAQVSTGGVWPDGTSAPQGNVALISCEDEAADTIVPRLMALGADLKRCHVLDSVPDGKGKQRPFNLKTDADALGALARDHGGLSLIIIDPISAYLDGVNSHSTADVRGALVPLQTAAERLGAAVIMVSHFNKGSPDSTAMSRVAGSGAFVAVCRSAWLVERDPGDTTGNRRVFAPMKNNIGDDTTGFTFEVEGTEVARGINSSRIRFLPGTISISADELVRSQVPIENAKTAMNDAAEFLADQLAGGSRPQTAIRAASESVGLRWRTVERAKKRLHIRARKLRDGWHWSLPEVPTEEAGLFDEQDRQGRQERQSCHDGRAGDLDGAPSLVDPPDDEGRQRFASEKLGGLGCVGGLEESSGVDKEAS